MMDDERLMTEVGLMVEQALPRIYLDISGESGIDIDEEFMQFLIPLSENSIFSRPPRFAKRWAVSMTG